MLKRRSIRTKLIVALTLLSAIVLLLASTGILGLYRYRQLADAVGRRYMEIPYATDLSRLSKELHESYDSERAMRDDEGMIEFGDSLMSSDRLSKPDFDQALISLEVTFQRYEAFATQQTGSVDATRSKRSLGEIGESLEALKSFGPLEVANESNIRLRLTSLEEQTDEHLRHVEQGMKEFSDEARGRAWIGMALSCTILAIAMVGVLLWAFHSLVVKPFQTLLAGSRLVAGGQFDHRIDLGTGDELSELADAMNDMTDRFQGALAKVNAWCTDLDRQVHQRTREVIQNEQLASVGYLAAGVAHEINNPLATVAWSAESLQSLLAEIAMIPTSDRTLDDDACEALTTNLRRIEDEAYRCKGITEKLLDFSRLSEVRRAETDLVKLVEDVVEMVGKVGKYRCNTLRTHAEDPVVAHVNAQEIRQVVLNLVTNALESVECDGAVDVYIEDDGTCGAVTVKDDGCGMSSDVLRHLFEPFFTRRRDGTGTGLGLSISYRIVSQHGGSLLAKSDGEGCGSEMQMLLPLTPAGSDDADPNHSTLGLSTLGVGKIGHQETA